MITALIMMGLLGLIVGGGLAIASKVFYVYVDPKIEAIEGALPGANCGGCGYPGCSATAMAISSGKASANVCVAGGPDVASAIAAILGVAVEGKEPDIAKPGCNYGISKADVKYVYNGLIDCKAAALFDGGMKVCTIGCLGLGTCVSVCQFNALSMGDDGLPVVNEKLCTGCGACERACPKHIIKLSSVTRRILEEYTTNDCTTPCQRACPAGINIREYIKQIALGDNHRAVQVIKERNPFPTVIGKICPQPCQSECRRKFVDEPVSINFLKLFCADFEKDQNKRILPFCAPKTNRKVAIIGGGVEGLSTAFFLARLGHLPEVFEATDKLGGLLRVAIEKERLPLEILDWDIQGIVEIGVTTHLNKIVGQDITIPSLLKDGFSAVFLASGGWDSRLAIGGLSKIEKAIPSTYLLIDLIKGQTQISCGENVVIYGGRDIAANILTDAEKMCKELGAKKITILNEVITRLIGDGNNLTYVESKNSTIPCNTLILSSGRLPEVIFIASEGTHEKWEGILIGTQQLTDYSAAIKAIGGGRMAAAYIHKAMYGIDLSLPENVLTPKTEVQNIDKVENVYKNTCQKIAQTEAKRCLQCGLICYEHS
ncbi:MAG: 4Fe-4S binding protein [Desulfobacterales bacterium]|nr:4Fe-4S binding protein [Desulfobacterales bacterium]MBF0398085.1 4Fe-4S binding protein [Desulfobacterales bacterium]